MKKRKSANGSSPRKRVVAFCASISLCFSGSGYTNPSGGVVVHGDIQFANNGNTLQVIQGTNHGIIDWNSFSIAAGQTTQFIQPGTSSVTLNRVTGGATSIINGSLISNGRVFLLNPAGILVGQGGVIDTAGFTASTLDLSNDAFLAGGDLDFRGNSQAGIVNLGRIHAVEGDVFLIASSVINEGSITAPRGSVGLASGNDVLLAESGSERIFVRGSGSSDGGAVNRGTIEANVAELKAHGGNIYGMAVKNEGRVAATSVSREGGQIFLRAGGGGGVRSTGTVVAKKEESGGNVVADSGPAGRTEISGKVDVTGASGNGGSILILGKGIEVFSGSLLIADGESGGGQILLGGGRRGLDPDFFNADIVEIGRDVSLQASAIEKGDGGEIISFSSGSLIFSGMAVARGGRHGGDGGFVEVSGKESVLIGNLTEQINVRAVSGKGGTLLIDPTDILIIDGVAGETSTINSNEIHDQDIVNFLAADQNLFLETVIGEGDGDITIEAGVDVSWNSDALFSLDADRDIVVRPGAKVSASGGGSIDFSAARNLSLGGEISSGTGAVVLRGASLDLLSGGSIEGGLTTGDIQLITDSIEVAGIIQSQGDLTIAPITSDLAINLGSGPEVPTNGLHLTNGELGFLSDGFNSIVIGDAVVGNGTITIGSVRFRDPTTFATPSSAFPGGEIFVVGDLTGIGDASFFFDGSGPSFQGEVSTTYLSGTISTEGYGITISDDVVLQGDSSIDTTAGGQLGGANVIIEGTVSGETQARNFSVNAGSDGQLFFQDTVGSDSSSLIGDIDWKAGRLILNTEVYSSGAIDIATSEYFILDDQGVIDSTNHLTIKANQGSVPVAGDFSGIDSRGRMNSALGEIVLDGRAGDFSAGGTPNVGVWLRSNSDSMAAADIKITGAAPNGIDQAVLLDGTISSSGWGVEVGSMGGDVELNSTISGNGLVLKGDTASGTAFRVNGSIPLFGFSADGGGGINSLDFGGYTGSWLEIEASQLLNIDFLSGRPDLFPTFRGSNTDPGRFDIDSSTGFTYEDDTRGVIDVTDFSQVRGGILDDSFTIDLGSANVFGGSLDGDLGSDTFTVLSGSASVFESDFNDGGVDLLDFGLIGSALDVNLDSGVAQFGTGTTSFSGIERIVGASGYTNRIEGKGGGDTIRITANGVGEIESAVESQSAFGDETGTVETTASTLFFNEEDGYEVEGPPDTRTVAFENFSLVSGGLGEDMFEVTLPDTETFDGELLGGGDNDFFSISPGGDVATINGEGGVDTLDWGKFSEPVVVDLQDNSATQVGAFSSIESLVGGSGEDTLTGTPSADQFLVTEENRGFVNLLSFADFEILNGVGGSDLFVFQNQANVVRFDGGSEADTFVLNDSNLTTGRSYTISDGSVSRNQDYEFSEIESLQLLLGSGNDNVLAGNNGLIQFVDGGGGLDTVDFGTTPVVGRTPFLFGESQLFSSNVEEFVFVKDESNNPDNINNEGGGNQNPLGDGTVSDLFSGTGLTDAAANAFSAFAANALITGQAVVVQIDGTRFQLQAPASLDGFFTEPPQSIIGQLKENLEVNAWSELAEAIGFSDSTILVRNDGPFSILLDGVPPEELKAILEENLLTDSARELVAALEMTLVIPVTSIDGAVSILTIPIEVGPATLALLEANLNQEALNELTAALDQ